VELVANCWDAGAKEVKISWPDEANSALEVVDDGQGMTKAEFFRRWGGMSYDRVKNQGGSVEVQVGGMTRTRKVFGRNGIGRFAGFCFASQYEVATSKDGELNVFMVKKGRTRPLEFDHLNTDVAGSSGTTITIRSIHGTTIRSETVRTELGRRFLMDPAFQVSVNGVKIAFDDIEDKGLEKIRVPIHGLKIEVEVKVIDAQRTDPTGRQHGVAWHVLGRLVGECGWRDPEQRSLIDGRRVELGERLEKIREKHEQGFLNSLEFLKAILEIAKDTVEAERQTDPQEEQNQAIAALTELFNEVKTQHTHVIVERIVGDIDTIVKQVRFDGWQATAQGEREVKQALRRALLRYKLHTDQELFDKAYGYIRQYY